MANTVERELGWDDIIENDDSGWELLPEGDYEFTVTGFTRGRYEGGPKMGPCNKAELELSLAGPAGPVTLKHNLFLNSKCEWRLCQFFTAIGLRKHGEQLKMDWGKVVGAHGRCRVIVRTYTKKDGSEGQDNDIKKFYELDEPGELQPTQAQGWTPGAF